MKGILNVKTSPAETGNGGGRNCLTLRGMLHRDEVAKYGLGEGSAVSNRLWATRPLIMAKVGDAEQPDRGARERDAHEGYPSSCPNSLGSLMWFMSSGGEVVDRDIAVGERCPAATTMAWCPQLDQ